MKIIHYDVRDDVRMCHMVDPIFTLDDQDFFCRDVSPLLLAQPQQKTPDANQHLIYRM